MYTSFMKKYMEPKKGIGFFPHFPVVLVGCGKGKKTNIITVALVHVFSFEPPCIGIGIAPARYSYELLEEHPEFTINIPSKEILKAVKMCGSLSGRNVDKFEKVGLKSRESKMIDTYGIEDCPVVLECKVKDVTTVGDHVWYIGEVVHSSVDEKFQRGDLLQYWAGEFCVPGEHIGKIR